MFPLMKIAHLNKEMPEPDKIKEEIKVLEQHIKYHPASERAYNRLMVLYRKKRDYKKELATIKKAIKIFEDIFKKRQPTFNRTVRSLSVALSKATGLADKKGDNLYQLGDLSKWKKRKELVSKKLKTNSGGSS